MTNLKGNFQVTQFVNGLFESRNELSAFKNHIRDFLVQSKEFSAQVRICSSLLYSSFERLNGCLLLKILVFYVVIESLIFAQVT